ncbi:heme lyase CcmF/NrfE family subunit [Acidiferrimicrobium sp. IK]|uniref:heme lyase CcmF/NrfE family subunit n=1 Tax=Acidiferrimicrobium sp. IK TaxID=2871700 RepID=UPI0021CB7226|nr:heme lyase CcmF/NrfE family subunit [Acidiferrimicrobium sp. IK]MCU4185849.1 heme lyase CcmF/NrfE family subunit [Acidiferrimicrobium sp. IK]
MNASVGVAAILLALLGAVAGAVTTTVGVVKGRDRLMRTGRSYVWVVLLGAVIATVALQHALITRDYTLAYVAHNDGNGTPLLFRITAMWSDLQGSILLWALVLAGYLAAMAVHFRARITDPLVAWATVVGFLVATFFFGLMLSASDPFDRLSGAPVTNGPGPDPLLQDHLLVAFHPPLLYLGLVGFTIPFAFAVASLITGRVGEGWMVETRRWTLFAWAFLSIGIVLGAWWSYQVLGWGGFWAWDPVENAAFIPWLTATAYIHSVMVQERRGMLRVWNLSLVMATFSLTILGTFLTRSGVLNSVHSFSNSNIGPELLGFFGVVVATAVGLLAWRGDRLRSPGMIDSPVSREGAFLANNLLFGAFALVVLLGTVFPLIAQAVNGSDITVGAPYFNQLTMPIVVCLLFLMAVAPVLPWRKASAELLRTRLRWPAGAAALCLLLCVVFGVRGLNPLLAFGLGAFAATSALRQLVLAVRRQGRRGLVGRVNGGMIVHLGVVVIAVAFAASHSYTHQTTLALAPGQTARFEGHSFQYLGMRSTADSQKSTLSARVRVDGGQVYAPAISQYPIAADTVGTPSVRSRLNDDLYLTLANPPATANGAATIGVTVEPLVMWVWIGGGIILLGTGLAAFPGKRRRRPTDPVSALPDDGGSVEDMVAKPAGADPEPAPALTRSRAPRLRGWRAAQS